MNNSKKISKLPWVFWISISIRLKWFKCFWKTRGSNYVEYQVLIFKISIGRPWLMDAVHSHRKNYSSHDYIRDTNKANLKQPFSFLIK
jgi:hypothetical protein